MSIIFCFWYRSCSCLSDRPKKRLLSRVLENSAERNQAGWDRLLFYDTLHEWIGLSNKSPCQISSWKNLTNRGVNACCALEHPNGQQRDTSTLNSVRVLEGTTSICQRKKLAHSPTRNDCVSDWFVLEPADWANIWFPGMWRLFIIFF